jgi:hypothetical protein
VDNPLETQRQAIRALTLAVAAWQVGANGPSVLVDRAVDALVSGLDTPGLRDLAGRAGDENWFEMRDLLEATFRELGAELPQTESEVSKLLALQFMCEQFISRTIDARQLGEWAHSMIGHNGPELAQDLVMLDDAFNLDNAQRAAYADDAARAFLKLKIL